MKEGRKEGDIDMKNIKNLMFITIFGLIYVNLIMISNVDAVEFQTSFYCAECHEDRYKEWSGSMHALAISDPIFRSAYMKAVLFDPGYREYCLKCHSPTTTTTKDFNLTRSISVEGVTCSFCHNVKNIDIKKNSYELNQDGTMVGPYEYSFSEKHSSNYSEILTKSEFCAGCHEFSLNGVLISETYSEWKEGPYSKEGRQCQDCHMEASPGYSSNNIKREKVYRHYWYGGHTGQFLERAFNIEYDIEKKGKKANINLNITNIGVGHKIPSGFPSRQVILYLNVTDDKNRDIYNDKKIYTKTLLDEYGNEVYDFWKAKSISKDNRIKPRESRIETFEFDVPDDARKLDVQIILRYHFEAEVVHTSLETINVELINRKDTISLDNMAIQQQTPDRKKEMSSEEVLSKEVAKSSKNIPGFGWIGFVITIIIMSKYRKRWKYIRK